MSELKQVKISAEERRIKKAFSLAFEMIRLPPRLQTAVMAVFLTRNGSAIFQGIPGTGKTTLIEILAKLLGLQLTKVTCAPQKVSLEGTSHRLFIPDLLKEGIETIEWKQFMKSDIIFLSEFNRAPQSFQDDCIDLLQYRELEAYGHIEKLPPHVMMFFDMNPYRGSLDRAIADRPLASITFPRMEFFARYEVGLQRYSGQSKRDIRVDVEAVASLNDLLKVQEEVAGIVIPQVPLLLATLLTESLSSCIHKRDQANRKYIPPCMSYPLRELGREQFEEADYSSRYDDANDLSEKLPCVFLGDICSCIAEPMAYRIDEATLLLAKAFAFLDKGRRKKASLNTVNQGDITQAFRLVVGNRLVLRDSIQKNWENSTEWFSRACMPYIDKRKLPAWISAVDLCLKLRSGEAEDGNARLQLKTIASKNHEVRPLARYVNITDFSLEEGANN